MGLSKEDIINYYKNQALSHKIGFILFTSLLFIFRKTIYKSFRSIFNELKIIFNWSFGRLPFSKKGKILDVEVA